MEIISQRTLNTILQEGGKGGRERNGVQSEGGLFTMKNTWVLHGVSEKLPRL